MDLVQVYNITSWSDDVHHISLLQNERNVDVDECRYWKLFLSEYLKSEMKKNYPFYIHSNEITNKFIVLLRMFQIALVFKNGWNEDALFLLFNIQEVSYFVLVYKLLNYSMKISIPRKVFLRNYENFIVT